MVEARLAQAAQAVEAHLDKVLAEFADVPVKHAMRYACVGGKALRGFLVLESASLHGVAPEFAIWPACAIEAMHGYSLVHDDLPSMDNDDLRRGQPTVHLKWDEATAILAGDALQSLAFEMVSAPELGAPEIRAALCLSLAQASGARGMVLGQALDIAAETAPTPLTLDQITTLQSGKTGALIAWAATAGALLGQADPAPLRQYAQALGLAFQIADDILDVTGDETVTGKRVQKDASAGKATFVSLLGLDGARARATQLVDEAQAALDPYGPAAEGLRQVAGFVIARNA